MIKRILVAHDGSQHAEKAFDFALDLAGKYSAEIVILSVVPPVSWPIMTDPITGVRTLPPTGVDHYYIELRARHEKVLAEALEKAKKVNPNLKVSTKLAEGRPASMIIETAREGDFDIIVVGSRGIGSLEELFLGSVSDRVANEAERPVLIVK